MRELQRIWYCEIPNNGRSEDREACTYLWIRIPFVTTGNPIRKIIQ